MKFFKNNKMQTLFNKADFFYNVSVLSRMYLKAPAFQVFCKFKFDNPYKWPNQNRVEPDILKKRGGCYSYRKGEFQVNFDEISAPK